MLARQLTFAFLLLASVAGCQSGRAGYCLFSDDRRIVAYRDRYYPELVYVADSRGAAVIGQGAAMLSRDGRFLLLIDRRDRHRVGLDWDAGDPVILYDVGLRKKYATALPRSMRYGDRNVFFEDGPTVTLTFGPDAYLAWSPKDRWRESWRPSGMPQWQFREMEESREPAEEQGSIVTLGPDGWNARRTVWVRADGSVTELLRQNDRPWFYTSLILRTPLEILQPRDEFFLLNWFRYEEWRAERDEKTVADLKSTIKEQRAKAATRESPSGS